MTLSHSAQSGQHRHAERGFDLYSTPPCATEALLRVERLPHRVWEPAAGRGAIVSVLRAHGHTVATNDIIDYGCPLDSVADFLKVTQAPVGVDCVIINPPFQIIAQFAAHALDLCSRVILLARLAFLESERRTDILEHRGLARVHVFRNRLPMMHATTGKARALPSRRVRVVRMGSQLSRPDHHRSYFVGGHPS
jgi:hypothetical protein